MLPLRQTAPTTKAQQATIISIPSFVLVEPIAKTVGRLTHSADKPTTPPSSSTVSKLRRVHNFKHFGRIVNDENNDWPALHHNLHKARKKWGMLARILDKEGAPPKAKGMFCLAIVQSILLCGAETWTITPVMMRVLRGFHDRVARQLAGGMAHKTRHGNWVHPPVDQALESAGLLPISECVRRRQASTEDHAASRAVWDLCVEVPSLSGGSRATRWWQQKHEAADSSSSESEESASEKEQMWLSLQ